MIRNILNKFLDNWQRRLISLNWIEISKGRILANYDGVKEDVGGKEVWPVLKANAYGYGLEQVAEILKVRRFKYIVVDSYYEALRIWQVSRQRVLLIGPMLPVNYSKINWNRVTIMVQSAQQVRDLSATGKKINIHLKINTGMNRQGVEIGEIGEVLSAIKMSSNIRLEGLMSHLANADNRDSSFTKMQENNFGKVIQIVRKAGFRPKYFHLEATAGIGKIKLKEVNAVRLGLGLYTGVLRLMSTLVKIRKVKQGAKISYGLTYQFKEDSWVGVIPVGYFEGLNRRLSNIGVVRYGGKYYPIAGNICMNMCMVDFGKDKPREYEDVEVIGVEGDNSFAVMAEKCGAIIYELMVGLNASIRRQIVD